MSRGLGDVYKRQLPTLIGKEGQQSHNFLYWEFNETDQIAVRMGDWKMVVIKGKPHLYNLDTDLQEKFNVADRYPDIVRQMKEIIKEQHVPNLYFKVTLPIN